MVSTSVENIFKEKNLKRTKVRVALLNYLLSIKTAQSYLDFKQALGANVDKSTLYRNLSAFEDAGIIHRINDHTGVSKYALGPSNAQRGNHAHFVCEKCESVFCVEENPTTALTVPSGFEAKSVNTIITGTCANC